MTLDLLEQPDEESKTVIETTSHLDFNNRGLSPEQFNTEYSRC